MRDDILQHRLFSRMTDVCGVFRENGISFHRGKPDRPLREMAKDLGIEIQHTDALPHLEYRRGRNPVFYLNPENRPEWFFCVMLHHVVEQSGHYKDYDRDITGFSVLNREVGCAIFYPPLELQEDLSEWTDGKTLEPSKIADKLNMDPDLFRYLLKIYMLIR